MKIFLSFAILMAFAFALPHADSWTIHHNKNLLLNTNREDEAKNVLSITRAELAKDGEFQVAFQAAHPDTSWKRTMIVVDNDGNTILEKDVTTLEIKNKELKNIFEKNATIKIYTWGLPKDPAKAALIRVRRVHLCTLTLK